MYNKQMAALPPGITAICYALFHLQDKITLVQTPYPAIT